MTTSTRRNPCARCTNGRAIATCNGCEEMLCITHFTEHRNELSNLMNNIIIEHDSLRHDLNDETIEHSLLRHINTWEQESIKIIQQTAQIARTTLQRILTKKKHDIITMMNNLTTELQSHKDTEDFTENEINKWTENLKKFQEILNDCSNITFENDKDPQSIIHLIKIFDYQSDESFSLIQSSKNILQISQQPSSSYSLTNEKFDRINSNISISDDDLTATYRSKLNLLTNRYIYGINRYSSGNHCIHLSIEKKGELPLFFGIINASKKYEQSIFGSNNSSVYGWYNMESFVISGKIQKYAEENILEIGDHMILVLNCDKSYIGFQHRTTKRFFQIPINLDKCPFPWKLIFYLPNINDSIRIIHEENFFIEQKKSI